MSWWHRWTRFTVWLRRRGPRLLLELLAVVVLLVVLEAFLTRDAVRGEAPAIEGYTLSGEHFSLEARRGETVLVYFWASWCPICELQHGTIEALSQGQQVITVAMQSGSADAVRAYLHEQGADYPVINDPEGVLSAQYGVRAVPASFVVDRQGQVRFVTRGYTSGLGLRVRLWWAGLTA